MLMTMIDYIDDDNDDNNDGDDIDRQVKANWSAGAHVEGGGNFTWEGGGGEQRRWETCAKYPDIFADVCKRNLFCRPARMNYLPTLLKELQKKQFFIIKSVISCHVQDVASRDKCLKPIPYSLWHIYPVRGERRT